MTGIVCFLLLLAAIHNCSCYHYPIQKCARPHQQGHRSTSIQKHIDLSRSIARLSSIAVESSTPNSRLWQIKGKLVNLYGLLLGATVFIVAAAILPIIWLSTLLSEIRGEGKRRRMVDRLVSLWSKVSLTLAGNHVELYGRENLPPFDEPVIYVPNHTCFLDVLVLSAFVPRQFKYLSKAEIGDMPIIGNAMRMARHVFLKRNDIRSTMECMEQVTNRLQEGSSMVFFAEGTRSPDGRLRSFKKGSFQIAKSLGVRVVPVSVGNLYRYMPTEALLPFSPIRDGFIRIHPPVETKDRTIKDIKQDVFDAVNSGLPEHQRFIGTTKE